MRCLHLSLIFLAGFSMVSLTCKKPTDPPPPPPNGPDTTSHNFVWEIDTLGDGNSSALYDVTVINDTLAYAVGEIYLRDSAGQFDPNAYNMARWDGQRWELMRIQFYTFCGQSGTGSYPAEAIFAFNAQDIWIGMDGSQVVRWNGLGQGAPMCIPVSVNKLWGENSNAMYAVGNGGVIAYYNGSTWTRLNSETTVDIHDIWGAPDPTSGELVILALASFVSYGTGLEVLKINADNSVTKLDTAGLRIAQSSIWFQPGKIFYVTGDGVFTKTRLQDSLWQHDTTHPLLYKNSVRGNATCLSSGRSDLSHTITVRAGSSIWGVRYRVFSEHTIL